MRRIAFALVAAIILVSCAPQQPQTIVVQAPPAQQQQQQDQTVIINEAPAPQVIVPQVVPVMPATGWCGYLRGSYLSPGMTVHVSYNPNIGNVLRRSASKTSEYMGLLEPGGSVYLLDGPYCDRGFFIYWHVKVLDKHMISNRSYDSNAPYNSVFTAETDETGKAWLVP